MSNLTELQSKLTEIFQINRPDLDFGIYKILNSKSQEISDYLQNQLPKAIEAAFSGSLKAELAKTLSEAGVSLESSSKYTALKADIAERQNGNTSNENQVYTHLLTFFSRYYEEGDFISQRRYKGDTYAIPYSGEEVMLHWANKDQYYTKSGENFSNYRFKLADGKEVFFKLIDADTAKDNRKDNDSKRAFVLAKPQLAQIDDETGEEICAAIEPISQSEDGNTLTICFEYQLVGKKDKQETINQQSCEQIFTHNLVQTTFAHLSDKDGTEKNPNRTVLEKHLADYTQKKYRRLFYSQRFEWLFTP